MIKVIPFFISNGFKVYLEKNYGDHLDIDDQKFLENGDKLKITVMYRGREFYSRKEDGIETLNKVVEVLKDISFIDKPVDLQGRRVSVVLSPK